MMKRFLCGILFAGFVLLLSGGEVTIFCTADIHGRAEKFAAFAPILRKNPDAIRIDCGDTMQGTLFAQLCKGEVMIDLLNAFHYDVWVPGNHDFNFGAEALKRAAAKFRGKTLGAEYHRENFCPAAWTLFKRDGHKIAIIGMTDPKMPKRLPPGSGWNFEPNRVALSRILPAVLAAKPDLIVLAWHAGLYTPPGTMYRFLSEFPEIDLVLGAHTHMEIPGQRVASAWYVQAGRYADCIARVTVEFNDKTGKLLRIRSELERRPETETRDAEAERILAPYRTRYQQVAEQTIAVTKQPLRLPEKRDNSAPVCRLGAEAMRAAAKSDAALFSVSALPDIGIPNRVTPAGIFRLLPYENQLYTVKLTGTEFAELVQEIGEASRRGRGVFRFSGVEVKYAKRGKWRARNVPETLTIAVTDYTLLVTPTLRGKPFQNCHISEREAVTAYLKQHPDLF